MALGWPSFDGEDKYLGPLTKFAGDSVRLIGREGADFKTTSTAAWPLQLCDWLAKLTADAAQASHTSTPAEALAIGVVGGRSEDQEPDKQEHGRKPIRRRITQMEYEVLGKGF